MLSVALVTFTTVISSPVSIAFGPVSPFFIGFVLIVPMVPIPIITTLPDKLLPMCISAVLVVIRAMLIIMQIRLRLIHHYFMTMIQIIIMVAGR